MVSLVVGTNTLVGVQVSICGVLPGSGVTIVGHTWQKRSCFLRTRGSVVELRTWILPAILDNMHDEGHI